MSASKGDSIDFRNEFLTRINKIRQQGCKCGTQQMPPAPPLVWNELLEKAAQGHAEDMYRKHYFSHQSKDGRKIQDRITTAGYTFKGFRSFVIGENIAYGQQSIEEVQNGWFKSEGHCRNLMNPEFKEIGVAWHNKYWVQDFGGRETFTPEQQLMIKKGARIIQKRG
ncbi:CAP domain-containing protein [Mucilaginibacter limnophilus]|nr:CAP domain-containing protein [Mucilaginibacter limnophilus]